ncbi:CheR family methyltransferase [Halomonadaceae bacterium KBTZ08]
MEESREFGFQTADFEKVRDLIHQRAGIRLSDSKKQLVYSRLSRRIRALGLKDFRSYLEHLAAEDQEMEQFINALTTNLTSFFRESHHFDYLASQAITLKPRDRPLNIWCAAASTGEEAYSIAMTLVTAFSNDRPPACIVASDIDSQVLRTAQAGVYQAERIADLSHETKKHFFLRGRGANAGKVRVQPFLRNMITFRQGNLLDTSLPIEAPLDIIFCRNVMIYFDKTTQRHILARMVSLLREGGLYFAGHSESFVHASDLVELIGRSVYRPVGQGGHS